MSEERRLKDVLGLQAKFLRTITDFNFSTHLVNV